MLSNAHLSLKNAELWTPQGGPQIAVRDAGYDDHVFSMQRKLEGYPAISAGLVPDPENFSKDTRTEGYFDINAFPIKYAGEDIYFLPRQLALFHGAIKAMAEDQHARSPYATDKHAVLYVTRFFLQPGVSLRGAVWHTDNIMNNDLAGRFKHCAGSPVTNDVPAHVYVTSDRGTTTVQVKPLRDAFRKFSDPDDRDAPLRVEGLVRRLAPYEIGLMNDYVWHRGNLADEPGLRTFVGMVYLPTEKVLDAVMRGQASRGFESGLNFD